MKSNETRNAAPHGREPLAQPQRFFTSASLLAACACITMVLWIAYDAVIPALPSISAEFGASSGITNLVLFPFLLAMALGQLMSGTLSDRFGASPSSSPAARCSSSSRHCARLRPASGCSCCSAFPKGWGAAP